MYCPGELGSLGKLLQQGNASGPLSGAMGTARLGCQVFVAIDRALVLALVMQHTTGVCMFNGPSSASRQHPGSWKRTNCQCSCRVLYFAVPGPGALHTIMSCPMSCCCPSINAILQAHTLCPPPTMPLLQPATARFDGAKGLCGPGKPTACPAAGTA